MVELRVASFSQLMQICKSCEKWRQSKIYFKKFINLYTSIYLQLHRYRKITKEDKFRINNLEKSVFYLVIQSCYKISFVYLRYEYYSLL